MRCIFDISPPISEALAVWPGDTPLRREVLLDMNRGDNVTLSWFGALLLLLGYLAFALLFRNRGPQDRLAGTLLVPL